MAWKELTMIESKRAFIDRANTSGLTMTAVCKEFGISRESGYELLRRFKSEGDDCVFPQSKRPHRYRETISDEDVAHILAVRETHRHWGGKKIKCYLEAQGIHMPSAKTIQRVLKKHGCINPEESLKHKPFIRFEHASPNELWQMDFKGPFKVGTGRCHPLTLLDDHSRYSLCINACENEQKETVKTALIALFREVGLPKRMTMDNGPPWGYHHDQRYTGLVIWLIRLGIQVSHSRPYHPQTQGKLERFHRTLKRELLSEYSFDTLANAQEGFDWWRTVYNHQRPHEGIKMAVPSSRYHPSDRIYPEQLPEVEYDSNLAVRKVDCSGKISYRGQAYRVGKGLTGQRIALKPSEKDGLMNVYFCQQNVLTLDLKVVEEI